ncbi:acylphosphatase [Methylocella sp.]|uniref:acylphosphatase n=1 Tax=Methylocella sp. TaxID=1978226 RepID=UPI0035B21A6A
MTGDEDMTGAFRRILRATVAGRVQGVGYRDWACGQAQALGLEGWVRNRASGEVEILLAGPAGAVARMCERLWRGPPAARVARVELDEADETDLARRAAAGFARLPTV